MFYHGERKMMLQILKIIILTLLNLFEVLRLYPHGYHKVDKRGHPIYYQLINKLKAEQLFKITTSERLINI